LNPSILPPSARFGAILGEEADCCEPLVLLILFRFFEGK
jgi:hypothetical protein